MSEIYNLEYYRNKFNIEKQSFIDEISRTIGYTATKNYLPNPIVNNIQCGVNCIVNNDKSLTLNGTNTHTGRIYYSLVGTANLYIYEEIPGLEDGVQYIISGCPTGGSETTYGICAICQDEDGTTVSIDDFGNTCTFTHKKGNKYRIYIMVAGGISVSNLTFYPMIRRAGENATYEPHKSAKCEINSIGKIVTDEILSVSATAGTMTTVSSYKNLTRGTYIATFRAIGDVNSLISGLIYKNGTEIEAATSITNTNFNSAQTNISTIFNITDSSDEIKFMIYSSVALTNRNGQRIKIIRIA